MYGCIVNTDVKSREGEPFILCDIGLSLPAADTRTRAHAPSDRRRRAELTPSRCAVVSAASPSSTSSPCDVGRSEAVAAGKPNYMPSYFRLAEVATASNTQHTTHNLSAVTSDVCYGRHLRFNTITNQHHVGQIACIGDRSAAYR